jgi:hypothetical protein
MFTCYFDASGGQDAGVTIVSGWIGQVSQWERFDTDWRLLLAKYDVPYFHMKEYAHSLGPYISWKGQDNKRANFLRLAAETIATRVHRGFACIVEHNVHAEVDREYKLTEAVGNPYCLAARTCIAEANLWVRKSERGIPIQYVFDEGDKGAGSLVTVIQKHNAAVTGNNVIDIPSFQPSRDRLDGRKGLTPLQAADFAAYEYLKAYRLGEDEPLYKYRKSIQVLSQFIDAIPGKYTKQDMITMCEKAHVAKRVVT